MHVAKAAKTYKKDEPNKPAAICENCSHVNKHGCSIQLYGTQNTSDNPSSYHPVIAVWMTVRQSGPYSHKSQ